MSAFSQSIALLIGFVGSESLRADLTYFFLNRKIDGIKPKPLSPAALVTNSELYKCVVSYFVLRKQKESVIIPTGKYLVYAVPAFLYMVNNLIYLLGLTITSPSDLHAAMLSKIPLTALVHHFIMARQTSSTAWLCLVLMTISLVVFNYPLHTETLLGPFLGILNSCISAFTSIYTEHVLKNVKISFWKSQFWLYFFGVQFGSAALVGGLVYSCLFKSDGHPISALLDNLWELATRIEYFVLPLIIMCSGFAVAFILRAQDNLVKLVGVGLSFPSIMITQFIFFPSLRSSVTVYKVIGGIGLCIGSLGFNYYKRTEPGGVIKNALDGFNTHLDEFLDNYTKGIDKNLTFIGGILSIGLSEQTEYNEIDNDDLLNGFNQSNNNKSRKLTSDLDV